MKITDNKEKHDVTRKRPDAKKLGNAQLTQEYIMELRTRFEALNTE
jgi:hypothetical protein